MKTNSNGLMRRAAALIFGLLVLPAVHAGDSTLSAQQLGLTERVLQFCGPINPNAARKLQDKVAEMVKGLSEADLAKTRDSEDYKTGYSAIDGMIAQADERTAKTLCSDSAAAGK